MTLGIRFRIKNRLSKQSRYSMSEFCVCIVDRYGLKEREVVSVVRLPLKGVFQNEDLEIRRLS